MESLGRMCPNLLLQVCTDSTLNCQIYLVPGRLVDNRDCERGLARKDVSSNNSGGFKIGKRSLKVAAAEFVDTRYSVC